MMNPPSLRNPGIACFILGVLALAGRAVSATAYDTLEQNYAKWKTHRPARYAYTYGKSCFCPLLTWRVEVSGDSVVKVSLKNFSGDTTRPSANPQYFSPDSIFARIKAGLDAKPDSASIRYDSLLGYPASAIFDPRIHTSDDEYSIGMMDFVDATTVAARRSRPSTPLSAGKQAARDLAGRAVKRRGAGATVRFPG
jgi:hypothetical protein